MMEMERLDIQLIQLEQTEIVDFGNMIQKLT